MSEVREGRVPETRTQAQGSALEPPTAAGQRLHCASCGAVVELAPNARTGVCLYCASPQVVERPASEARPNPSFVIPFTVAADQARTQATRWVRGSRWAPASFRQAPVENLRGLYLPAALYTAAVDTEFEAEIGERYTTHRAGTKNQQEVKTEWRSLRGRYATWLPDLLVSASRGLDNQALQAVEPFETHALRRYQPALVAGWSAEEPSVDPKRLRFMAREEASAELGRQLQAFMPGDETRGLRHAERPSDEDLEPVLLPLWVLPVRYGKAQHMVRLLVNGQTGKVAGKRPVSWVKVALSILLLVGVVGLAVWVLSGAVVAAGS